LSIRWLSPFSWEKRYCWYAICVLYFLTTYMVSNQFPLIPPQYLPLTALDRAVPLIPITGWIYASVYFVPVVLPFFIKDRYHLNLTLMTFFLMATIEAAIFFSFPTAYPRELFPLPGGWDSFPLNYLRMIDKPNNCFPSQHVSFAFLTAFIVERVNFKAGAFVVLWALAIALSTLTTKQHYIWDLVFGYALTRIIFLTMLRIVPKEAGR